MEVSSHALVLHRADAIHFAAKVFTNLSQDHLDFHADMEDYFEAKRLLFSGEGGAPIIELEGGVSVINVDDAYGRRLAEDLDCGSDGECVSYSAAGGQADLSARDVTFDASGSRFVCATPEGEIEVRIPLPGDFNVSNALAALSVAHALGLDLAAADSGPRFSRAGARPLRVDRRGPALRGGGRLRAHARLAGERARGRPPDHLRPPDLGLRRRWRPRPREAAADGPGGRGALRRRRGHFRQPPLRGAGGDHRADRGRNRRSRPRGGRGGAGPAGGDRDRPRSRRARATPW